MVNGSKEMIRFWSESGLPSLCTNQHHFLQTFGQLQIFMIVLCDSSLYP